VTTVPRSAIQKLLADMGVDDPESVFKVIIDPGHVTVFGYERDQLEVFGTQKGANPPVWNRVWPVDVQA